MSHFSWLITICYLLLTCFGTTTIYAQNPTNRVNAVNEAMLDFDLDKLNNLGDTNAKHYFIALAYVLHNQPDKSLLTTIALTTKNPFSGPALDYLLKSYTANGQYDAYCRFADQLGIKPVFYADADAYRSFPPTALSFLTDIKAVPFTLRKKSYVIVTAKLNGQKARLMLDTGATFTVVTEGLAKRAGIVFQASQTPVTTSTTGQTTGSNALVNRLTFGNIDVQHLPVKCFPSILRGLHIDGLIGLDILRQLTYTIDFKSRLCTFRKPVVQALDSPANLFRERVALLRATTLAGKPLNFVYDSGSNECSLTTAAADKVTGYRLKKSKTRIKGLNGTRMTEHTQKIGRFQFNVADRTVTSEWATFTNRETLIYDIPADGITGNKPFHTGTLVIDFPNGQFTYKD